MIRKIFRTIFFLVLYTVVPMASLISGYTLTESYFRTHLIPYPEEVFGAALGLVLAFWSLALLEYWRIYLYPKKGSLS